MIKVFGITIGRTAPSIVVQGTAFERISAVNQANEMAVISIPNSESDAIATASQSFRRAKLPEPRQQSSGGEISGDYNGKRQIQGDPRDSYWGVLPNKIQPKQAQQMIRAAQAGDIWQRFRLYTAMTTTWPKFAMAMHQLREAAAYAKYVVHPFAHNGEEPSANAKKKKDTVARAIASMNPNPFKDEKGFSGMIYNFTDAIANGVSMEEIIWNTVKKIGGSYERLPKASAWIHPRHFTFSQSNEIVLFKDDYNLAYNVRKMNGEKVGTNPDPDFFICSQFMSCSGSALNYGLMMPVILWWVARQYGFDMALETAKNFGRPFVDVTYKIGMTPTEKAQLLAEITKGLANRVLMHVEGSTVVVEKASTIDEDDPQRWLLAESDRECLYILLGQTGSTISEPGKLGNSDDKNDVKKERIKGIAEWVSQNPLDQFARAVCRANYPDGDEECPSIKPDFSKPLTSQEVATLCTATSSSEIPFVADNFYQTIGMPKPEPGQTVLIGGKMVIMGEPLTDDELHEQNVNRQKDLSAVGDQKPKGSDNKKKLAKATDLSRLLMFADENDLSELESLVTASERAPYQNGEAKALNEKLSAIKRKSL